VYFLRSGLQRHQKGYTLFSEQAFYYSYYADLVAADDYLEALAGLTRDRIAEYPNVINAMHRFNIYSEV
jgi:CHASE3 domain sensor protein